MKECIHTYRHALTHTDKTSIYELCKLLSFLLQCVTVVVWNKSEFYWSKASAAQFGPWDTPYKLLVVPSRGAGHPSLPTFFSTRLVFSVTPFKYFSAKWWSPQGGTEEQSTVSPTRIISETIFSVFLLLTAHALLAASSFTVTPPSIHAGLFHTILCDAKQDHTTMSGERRWACFWDEGCRGKCYSSLWRTGGSSLCDRAVRTLSNFS